MIFIEVLLYFPVFGNHQQQPNKSEFGFATLCIRLICYMVKYRCH